MASRFLQLLFLLVVLISCEKKTETIETVTYKDKTYSWKRDLRFSGESGILLNGLGTKTHLHISAIGQWCNIDTENNYDNALYHDNYLNSSINRRIPITNNIFTYYRDEDNALTIHSSENLYEYLPNIKIEKYDTTFLKINDSGISRESNFMAITDNMYCLVPYLTKTYQSGFFIIKPNSALMNENFLLDPNIDNAIIKYFTLDLGENENHVYFTKAFYNSFFVNLERDLYKIDTLGNYSKVLNQNIFQMINLSDSLIAFGRDFKTYLSIDQGESWNTFLEFPKDDFVGSNASYHNFEVIDNKIIAYPRGGIDQLYYLRMEENAFRIDTIPSDGLENTDITSISEFNEKIYITTLSGLYYKEKGELLKRSNN